MCFITVKGPNMWIVFLWKNSFFLHYWPYFILSLKLHRCSLVHTSKLVCSHAGKVRLVSCNPLSKSYRITNIVITILRLKRFFLGYADCVRSIYLSLIVSHGHKLVLRLTSNCQAFVIIGLSCILQSRINLALKLLILNTFFEKC